jgi:hypothetical protein
MKCAAKPLILNEADLLFLHFVEGNSRLGPIADQREARPRRRRLERGRKGALTAGLPLRGFRLGPLSD